jgi:hypothetical protein
LRVTIRLLACLSLLGIGLCLGADEISLFDPYPLRAFLAPGEDLFLPRSMGTATESLLMGVPSAEAEQLAYFQYDRGTLVLDEEGLPSEKTLIRFFLDSLGESLILPGQDESRGAELSRPFQGGTLYFSRLKPYEVQLLTSKKVTLPLKSSSGIYTSHFEAADDVFWLGDGVDYFCYDNKGEVRIHYMLDSLVQKRALFSAAFKSGRLCLVLEGGEFLFLGFQSRESLLENSTDLSCLFVEYYNAGQEYIDTYRPELLQDFTSWTARSVENLYKKDPLNKELSELHLLLN